jgi:hypothetical protein
LNLKSLPFRGWVLDEMCMEGVYYRGWNEIIREQGVKESSSNSVFYNIRILVYGKG